MKRFISFGSIEQFRTVVKNVQWSSQYKGKDDNDEPIIDKTAKAPMVKAIATEKIHGTNASVCYSLLYGLWVQSRNNIITPEKDNAGCAYAVEANKVAWLSIIGNLAKEYGIDITENIITVYFEFCGGNIQKNSCVTGLDKMSIIFRHFKVSPIEPITEEDDNKLHAKWYETKKYNDSMEQGYDTEVWLDAKEYNIYNVMNFPTISLEIDFNRPDIAQNEMVRLTEEVEKNSGIANYFNKPDNIGEGWVWAFQDSRGNIQRWKTKGEEHSKGSGKIKKLKPVDSVLEQKKVDFVNNVCATESRCEQMYSEIINSTYNGIASKMSMNDVKLYLQLVFKDVIKENMNEIHELGLSPKQINPLVSKVAVSYFKTRLDKEVGI